MPTLCQNNHDIIWQHGISKALPETAKHKCRAAPKFKQRLNIVIHGRRDPVMMHTNIDYTQCIRMTIVLSGVMLDWEGDDSTIEVK